MLDLVPQARRQIDYYLIFSGVNDTKLNEPFINADLDIDFETFKNMYQEATKGQYNFFYVNASECEYRKNFDTLIIPDKKSLV